MKIKYIKANPTENKTILVLSEVQGSLKASVAAEMLKADPDAEQVGFLERPADSRGAVRLQMMGGEFCGNAAISAAAKVARETGLLPGETENVLMEVSGAEGLVECSVKYDGNVYTGTVDMPLPKKTERRILEHRGKKYDLSVVFLPGITHIIFDKKKTENEDKAFMEAAVKQWAEAFEEDAVGLIEYSEETCEIEPLVYVRETNSLYWERGCGTGTAAVGVYMTHKYGKSSVLPVKQPGGTIIVETGVEAGELKKLKITGKVFFEGEGVFETREK